MANVEGNLLRDRPDLAEGIYFAVPTAEASVSTTTVRGLLAATQLLNREGIRVRHAFVDLAEVSRARNILAAKFLSDPRSKSLLFVDNDIGFPSALPERLFKTEFPFVGAACPSRSFSPATLDQPADQGMTAREIMAGALRFNIRPEKGARSKDGFLSVERIGTGFTMIDRQVFVEMIQNKKVTKVKIDILARANGVKDNYYNFFAIDHDNNVSEDFAFCDKYREIGGKIYACVDEYLAHVGPYAFLGKYLDQKIKRKKSAKDTA